MQDRVPLYPGRVTLTPVSGPANTYDLTRADQPTQEGTPLSKASLLKDATAALFGKTNAAVPDDILSLLSKSALAQIKGKYTETTTIGTLPVGSTITLNVGGTAKEFIVVHQGKPSSLYDDSCNGTWLLMKDIYENRAWNSSNSNSYKASTIHSYLNSTFLNLFDSNTKDAIKQVKIPYVNGTGGSAVASGANGLAAQIFLLSGYEAGWTTSDGSYFPVDGAKLGYFSASSSGNSKRIANYNGSAAFWGLRSPYTSNDYAVVGVSSDGNHSGNTASASFGIRPALVLPSTFAVYADPSGNIYTEQEYETKITDVLGNLISIPGDQIKDGVRIATGSYIGTGTYGSSHPNSLTFEFEPKALCIVEDGQNTEGGILWINPLKRGRAMPANTDNSYYCYLTWSGKTVSWYDIADRNSKYQHNVSGTTYHYIAIG